MLPNYHKSSKRYRNPYYHRYADRDPVTKYVFAPLGIFVFAILLFLLAQYANYGAAESARTEPQIQQTQTPAQEQP